MRYKNEIESLKSPLVLLSCLWILAADAPLARAQSTAVASPDWKCKGVVVRVNGPTTATVGSQIRYQIVVSNGGDCNISAAQLTSYLPLFTTYLTATPTPSIYPSPAHLENTPPPPAIAQIQWNNMQMGSSGYTAVYETVLVIQGNANRTMTNTACVEHPDTGRICDALDTFVRPKLNP